MRVSLSWLQEYVDIDVSVDKLAELLHLSGTAVEGVTMPGRDVKGVVVAEVVDIREHPNADNLVLVDAKTSDSDVFHIVCGARNFAVGDRVPYAQLGAKLPGLEISERKIRGEQSQGMLCSGAELGVSKDHSGILVLPEDSPLNEDVTKVLGLDDAIFEFELTPNRPDCMSVVGIAREVSVLLNTELRVPEVDTGGSEDVSSSVTVKIADPKGCPRYLARYIAGVKVAPSPTWMAARLLSVGMRPISNIVDITNYVLMELGHPLHAFDAALVRDEAIVVRRAKRGERLTTLDGVDRKLSPDDLLITDPKHALAIAGVMGGGDSEVGEETENVILESAYFDPDSIALTARRHQLRTEASARFERGADPEMAPIAAARAAALMAELAGGTVAAAVHDEYPEPVERRTVTLRTQRTGELMGAGLETETQITYLKGLGMNVKVADTELEVEVPTFRPDIHREEDLVEEVARIAGFERLPSTLPPGRKGALDAAQVFERRLRRALSSLGVAEAWTTSLMRAGDPDALGLPPDHPARRTVVLANPMSEEEPAMRTTLIPGLLRSIALNSSFHRTSVALFEIARVYEPSDETLPTQPLVLGLAASGERIDKSWAAPARRWDFATTKGVLEAALDGCGARSLSFDPVSAMPFHPTRAAAISLDSTSIGSIGELHPSVCETFEIPEGTCVAELALAAIVSTLTGRERIHDLPRFPAVYIDVAVVVDEATPATEVEAVIRAAGDPELVSVRLFDLYRGEQIESGKKSLAYALELQALDRTLTDDEAAAVRSRIVESLRNRLNATLRV